jgi:hypothetical protein
MPWFKIDDGFHCHPKVLAAGTAAVGLYVRCGSWAAQQASDGVVPKQVARMYGTARMIRALIDVGLWHENGHGCESCPQLDANSYAIHQFLERNPSRVAIELDRQAKTERQQRWRDAKRKSQAKEGDDFAVDGDVDASTWPPHDEHGDADPPPTHPDPSPTTTSSVEEAGAEDEQAPVRADVERVCRHLADRIEANGSPRPTITVKWRTEARLLLDKDKRTVEQVIRAIDWCQNDAFWKANVLSMPTLRKKYDQLRLKAQAEQQSGRTARPTSDPSSEWMHS